MRALILLAAAGCGTEWTAPVTFQEVYPVLFPVETRAQCNFCHALPANDKSNGLLSMGMDEPTAFAALKTMGSAGSHCGTGWRLIVPYDPDASLLLQKLSATPPCGDRMPLGGSALSADDLALVELWIGHGALE